MRALILAAGRGSRLATATPKCLVEVGGRPLLLHQLDALRRAGVDDVTVVVGHRHERVRSAAGRGVRFVLNERYAETNSLFSFWLAREAAGDDLLVLNCDVLFPDQVLARLLAEPASALAFDSGSGEHAEHMKVHVREGRLVEMSKELEPHLTSGENLGLVRLAEDAAAAAFRAAAGLLRRGRERDWLGAAINVVARRHRIACVDVAGMPWVEIDFAHDLRAARRQVWPAMTALATAQRRARPELALARAAAR